MEIDISILRSVPPAQIRAATTTARLVLETLLELAESNPDHSSTHNTSFL